MLFIGKICNNKYKIHRDLTCRESEVIKNIFIKIKYTLDEHFQCLSQIGVQMNFSLEQNVDIRLSC